MGLFESVCVVGERGQITLPKTIRDIRGIKSRDKVIVKIENAQIMVEKMPSKKENEKLLKEYYAKYSGINKAVNKEWEAADKEANRHLDDR